MRSIYRKRYLPNYGVFDEDRYFAPGRELVLLRLGKTLIGPTVCEDIWQPGPPATDLALAGAELLVNISASPYHVGKAEDREEMLVTRARDNSAFLAFCNLVGGQDELVFDGHSVVLDDEGEVLARAPRLRGGAARRRHRPDRGDRTQASRRPQALARPRARGGPQAGAGRAGESVAATQTLPGAIAPFDEPLEQMRRALVLGLSDYVEKNGFREVVLGLSGGIDSALVAALATDALGPERVHCVSMPSRYSSEGTRTDAERLAASLGCDFRELADRDRRSARSTRWPEVSTGLPQRTSRLACAGCS